jgi:broad specificity phosphatase PhoE
MRGRKRSDMKMLIGLAALAAMLALSPAPAQEAPTRYVMRHLDTPKGERDPDLLPTGAARAKALVAWFEGKPLAAVFATPYRRTQQTAAPIAAARGLTVQTYDPADTDTLIARVKAIAGPVLIVGHSNTVPDIVAALGGERPGELAHEDFGDVWTLSASGTVRQRLGE